MLRRMPLPHMYAMIARSLSAGREASMVVLIDAGAVFSQSVRWRRYVARADIRIPGLGQGWRSKRPGYGHDGNKPFHFHLHDHVVCWRTIAAPGSFRLMMFGHAGPIDLQFRHAPNTLDVRP